MISTEYGNELKSITKNAGIGIFGIAFMNIMAFVNNAIITRALGADSYGLFVLVTNVFGFIVIISQLGFGGTIIRFVSFYIGKEEYAKAKGTIQFSIKVLLIISLIVLPISFFLSPIISEFIFNQEKLTPLLQIILLSLPFSVIGMVLYSSLNGLKLIKYQVIASKILSPIFFFVLINLIFSIGLRLTGLIWVMLVMAIINSIIAFYYINKGYFSQSQKIKPKVEKREILSFALPLYINRFLNSAIKFAPIFIMGYFLSNRDIGIYNVGFKIAMLVSVSMGAFGLIFAPTISGLFANNNKPLINRLFKTITKWIFTIALITFSVILLFADTILNIFGNDFTTGINVLILLIIGELVNAGTGLSGNIIVMSGRPKVALFNASLSFITIIILSYFLIPKYGVIGAAFSFTITTVLISSISIIELYYYEKIHPFTLSYFKPIFAGIFAFIIINYLKNFVPLNKYAEMISGTIIFFVIFIIILKLLKFDSEDKFIINVIENKLFNVRNKK